MLITQRVEAIETIKNSLSGFSLGSETWPKLPPWLGETISQAGDSIFSRETDAVNLTGGKVNPFESRKEKKKKETFSNRNFILLRTIFLIGPKRKLVSLDSERLHISTFLRLESVLRLTRICVIRKVIGKP